MAGSSSAGHAIIYRESALTFEEWNTAELHEQVSSLYLLKTKTTSALTFEEWNTAELYEQVSTQC